ncbi:MAG: O-antigen ligase family protein [Planctomycetota bacterium]|nr:O-antigen ligase family protein [Planctomycetota bacterium]
MRQHPAQLAEENGPADGFDTAMECLLVVLLAFMPLAFGTVDAWSEEIVVAISGAMIVCLLLKIIVRRDFRCLWSWACLPMGLFLLLAVAQLVPLPAGILSAVSGNTAALKGELLGDLPRAETAMKYITLSFYSLPTERTLRLALAVAAVFLVTVNVYRSRGQIKRLLAVIAAVGGAVAFLALVQIVTGAEKIYWLVPTGRGIGRGGPFLNGNNYCQFMNLSLGAALGLLLIRLEEAFRAGPVTLSNVVERLGEKKFRAIWCLVGVVTLGVMTVFLSLSRGGMISLLIGLACAVVVLVLKRRLDTLGWVVAVMALGAFICVLYVGFDAVYDRLVSLGRFQAYQGRWQLAKETATVWTQFPVFGTGLGTHRFIHPMFDSSTIPVLAAHAENEYAQLAEETGVIGLLLVAFFGLVIGRNYLRCIRQQVPSVRIAAIGLGAGLLAVMVHSFTDFGQRLPANACLSAVICGLLVSMGRMPRPQGRSTAVRKGASALARPVAAVGLIGVLAVWTWAMVTADTARRAEACWREARLREKEIRKKDWAVGNADYAGLISVTGRAVQAEPRNVIYRHALNVYRWRSVSRLTEPGTGNLILGPEAIRSAEYIVDDLDRVRSICPTFGPSYCLAGQLERFVLGRARGAALIRKGFRLAPCDADACLAAGTLEAHEGNIRDSIDRLQRALKLNDDLFQSVINVYLCQINRPELAVEVVKYSVRGLLCVARIFEGDERYGELAVEARAQVAALVRSQCEQPDAAAPVLAHMAYICLRDEDYDAAVKYYRRALAKDCSKIGWRLNLAEALAKTGQTSEALDQAHICLRLMPQMAAAKRMIADLRIQQTLVE